MYICSLTSKYSPLRSKYLADILKEHAIARNRCRFLREKHSGRADMGIHNVCDRLNLIYGEVAHVDVNSTLGVEQASG